MYQTWLGCAAVTTMALLAGAGTAHAAERAAPGEVPQLYVVLDLAVPGGIHATVAVKDSGLAVYVDRYLGFSIGARPRIRDAELGLVDLEVMRVEAVLEIGVSFTEGELIDDVAAAVGAESFVALGDGLLLEARVQQLTTDPWTSLGMNAEQCQKLTPPSQNQRPREACCVTCNGGAICGCIVNSSCGSCCGCGIC